MSPIDLDQINDEQKRTALYLHGLERQDREWILQQLPLAQSRLLQRFLDELSDLGLPKESFSFSDVKKDVKTSNPLHQHVPTSIRRFENVDQQDMLALTKYIDETPLSVLHEVFSEESLELISMVLRIRTWSWHVEFVEQFDTSRRFQLREVLQRDRSRSSDHWTSKFQLTMLDALAVKIHASESTSLQNSIGVRKEALAKGIFSRLKRTFTQKARFREEVM